MENVGQSLSLSHCLSKAPFKNAPYCRGPNTAMESGDSGGSQRQQISLAPAITVASFGPHRTPHNRRLGRAGVQVLSWNTTGHQKYLVNPTLF